MKYLRFMRTETPEFGHLEGDTISVLDGDYLAGGSPTGETIPLNSVKLLAPVSPKNVVAIGLNYADHAAESNMEVPPEPMMFLKLPTCIIGPGDTIQLVEQYNRNDYEAELVVVIGKTARMVSSEDAMDYVFGFTCGNDVSDRTYQKADKQWVRAKACDTYGPIGPIITDEIDPHAAAIRTRLNGDTKQDSNTDQMVFNVPRLIEHVTKSITLSPGDVIFTGTPPGIGPMKRGDTVEIEIEGIGVLQNPVDCLG